MNDQELIHRASILAFDYEAWFLLPNHYCNLRWLLVGFWKCTI